MRWIAFLVCIGMCCLGCQQLTGSTAHTYWPHVACPDHNTHEAHDICLVTHHYQTTSNRTNLHAFVSDVSRDGQWLAIGGIRYDGARATPLLLVEVQTGTVTDLDVPSSTQGVAFNADTTLLAATGMTATVAANWEITDTDGLIRLWEVPTGKHVRDLRAPVVANPDGLDHSYNSVLFSPDGQFVIGGRNVGDVVMWDATTGAVAQILAPPRWGDGPSDLSISTDGTLLASASQFAGPYVTVYDLTTGTVQAELDTTTLGATVGWPQDVAISPDGTTIAIATVCRGNPCDALVWLWDWDTNAVRGLAGHVWDVHSIVFHPDGRWLASGGTDNSIRIWDWRAGQEIARMEAPMTQEMVTGTPVPGLPANAGGLGTSGQGWWAPVDGLSVTADGRMLVYTESANGQTRIWRLPPALWQDDDGEEHQ